MPKIVGVPPYHLQKVGTQLVTGLIEPLSRAQEQIQKHTKDSW